MMGSLMGRYERNLRQFFLLVFEMHGTNSAGNSEAGLYTSSPVNNGTIFL